MFLKNNEPQNINYKTEILSGITVALALVPESVAFAMIAGLSPITGLYAAIMVGLVTSLFGGRPGMISGATGAVAIVIVALAKIHGVEYIFATVVLAGIIQILAWGFGIAKFMRLVPHPVVYGFVNGLAIVIFMAQLDYFKNGETWMSGMALFTMLGLVALTMLIIWGLPKLTKAIPASLASILTVFAVVVIFGIQTTTVGDISSIAGGFPPFHIPAVPFSFETLQIIFPYACIVAAVGLIESLLTLNIVDEITGTHGKSNKEAMAQGAANITSWFFSGMWGCAMIGQSLINVSNGARTRISGVVAAVCLLVFVMFGSSLIEQVPMAALVGLMFMVSIGTFEWASLRTFTKFPKMDVFVMIVVTLVTVFVHNLALAVLIGVIIAALAFAWDSAKNIHAKDHINKHGEKIYKIHGPLFFGSTKAFLDIFDIEHDPKHIIINFKKSRIADMSAIEAINKITERYKKKWKKVRITHVSTDSKKLLKNAETLVDINIDEDPSYTVMTGK